MWLASWVSLSAVNCELARAQNQPPSKAASDELGNHIAALIGQLSDANYSRRLNAQSELERIGVLALDQLHAASFHADPQIASTARYVVQSNQFSWSWDTDPVSVRMILSNYGAADSEKSLYIDQLQRLEHDEGFAPLCRLVRYETRSGLAKRAALILLRCKPMVGQTLESRKEALRSYLDGGQSQASRWLLKYATNEEAFDVEWWQQTLANELQQLKAGSAETNLELVLELHKWVVEQVFDQSKLRPYALSVARSILTINKAVPTLETKISNESVQANEFAQWALKYKLPEIVQEQHARLSNKVVLREFLFGYLLAESYLLQSKNQIADAIAKNSLNQIACNEKGELLNLRSVEDPNAKLSLDFSNRRNVSDQVKHANIAQKLESRGQFEWAEAEFRLALNDDLTNKSTIEGMSQLAAMLQIQGKHVEAAVVLEPFVTRYQKEPMFRKQVDDWKGNLPPVLSNYHLYVADAAKKADDLEKAAENYWQSIELEPDNIDAVIGLYRLPLSETDRLKLHKKQQRMIVEYRQHIREDDEVLKKSPPGSRASYANMLAIRCNNLAWAIVNTEGSKDEALYLSRKACTLAPDQAENLDTLAYCYAAMELYHDAVEQQRRAVELKPHHPGLVKALHRFEAKLRSAPQSGTK